jgi:hypothetical protein
MHRRMIRIILLLFLTCFFFETAHAATASSTEWVQKAYIAYYGRPGDPAGVEYWAGRLDSSGGNLSSIIDAFGNSQEFTNNFGSLSNSQLIDTIYQQMFNRAPDAAGKAWYLGQLNSGAMTLQSITLNVLGGAQGNDLSIINNKLVVAAYFTRLLESSGVIYESVSDAKDLLSLVDETAASVENAKSDGDVLLVNWGPSVGTGKLPDTGQTTSYTNTFGEDADYTINSPSYTKLDANGNTLPDSASEWSMVKDNVTGLIWENKTDDGGIHDKDNTYTWQNAKDVFIAHVNNQNFGGHSDWRMPTVKELSTLVYRGNYNNPSVNIAYFPNMMSADYWSFTTIDSNLGLAWYVSFHYGYVDYSNKSGNFYVCAVRGGQSGAFGDSVIPGRMVDNGDGSVTDTKTGLMWQQADAVVMTWAAALTYCENLQLANHDDWRLPNINELQSIVDYSKNNPSIDTVAFPGTMSSGYWSSTTGVDSNDAWYVYFNCGFVYDGYKYNSLFVRAVRGEK